MKYVMITGATSGIGYEISKLYFKKGYSLILVGRNKIKLQNLKKNLVGKNINQTNQSIRAYVKDLSLDNAGTELYNQIKKDKLVVEILINNAGAGYVGEFKNYDYKFHTEIMRLNMDSVTQLTYCFGKDMCRRKSGKILNIASTGGYHPGAYTALYYATKAYVLSLSEALNSEMKPYGVSISALCPGATDTNFSKKAGRKETKLAMSPKFVAKKAISGVDKNKRVIVPGVKNKLFVKLPRNIAAYLVERYQDKLREIN